MVSVNSFSELESQLQQNERSPFQIFSLQYHSLFIDNRLLLSNNLRQCSRVQNFYFLEIKLLQEANEVLSDRYGIKTKYNELQNELRSLEAAEAERKSKYDKVRRKELIEMEHIGRDLCQEQSKVLHQIEHINWHLTNAHPHEIGTPIEFPQLPTKLCHTDSVASGHGRSHSHNHAMHGKHQCSNKNVSNMVKYYGDRPSFNDCQSFSNGKINRSAIL